MKPEILGTLNAETLKAIKNLENNIEVYSFDSLDEMFESLNI